ncbi:uncharacterized protein LOC113503532 [Trichoplusia ni]|uniref:Uncharacterized protein LOC113503532 n=1 Tax=Trichoplusia ni TaxID=7111 RepID=A0A7E5WL00_TRINI|nr:uncharacterized protein LOC113503532 [Trichoplusia ni]
MQRTPTSNQKMKSSSQPDLSTEYECEDQVTIRNVNIRKRKNPDHQEMMDLKEDLLQSFKVMMIAEMAVIKQQNSKILESNAEIKKQLELNAENYRELSNRVLTLEKKHEAAVERIDQLEIQLNGIQKQSLKNTIEIRNISYEDKENVLNIVNNVYKTLKITGIDENATIYRRGKKNGPIVIQYQNAESKEILLKSAKQYNSDNKDKPLSTDIIGMTGGSSRIYISESLTPMSRKILAAARDLVKNGSFKYCWTSRGNVLLRKEEGQPTIVIKSLSQITEISSE